MGICTDLRSQLWKKDSQGRRKIEPVRQTELSFSTKKFELSDKARDANNSELWLTIKITVMTKVWFITGSSRGLGRSLTEAVLANGDQVAATARNPEQLKDLVQRYPDQVYPIQLDVTDKDRIHAAVEATVKHFGRIDVLVNNAGFGITGAAEAFTDEQVRSQLDTNLYAPIEITRAVLPVMRKQRSGRILQISSIGGRVGGPGLTMYQAAKFGLGGFTEALAREVAPLGIKVTVVEPGGFRTDWGGSSMSCAASIPGRESQCPWDWQSGSPPSIHRRSVCPWR